MPKILSKKEGGVYKYHRATLDDTFLCDTFQYGLSSTNHPVVSKCDLDASVAKDVDNCQRHSASNGDGLLPEDMRIGPPQAAKRQATKDIANGTRSNELSHSSSASQQSSGLTAAKLQCNEWGLPNRTCYGSYNGALGYGNNNIVKHPSVKSHTYCSRTQYLKKRRNAIDLGRRARVLGKFLHSIDEEEDHELENLDCEQIKGFFGQVIIAT